MISFLKRFLAPAIYPSSRETKNSTFLPFFSIYKYQEKNWVIATSMPQINTAKDMRKQEEEMIYGSIKESSQKCEASNIVDELHQKT